MRRPHAAGRALEALTPLRETLTALEATALEGRSLSVVTMATELAATCAGVAREAMALILAQAARAQPASASCACGGEASSKGFECTSFVGRFGRVSVCRRRMACARCDTSGFPFDQAWGLPTGEYADDVREATERLSCRLGSFEEAGAELQYLWRVAPDASTAQRWVAQDGAQANALVQAEADARWKAYEQQAFAEARGDQRAPTRTAGFGVVEVDGVHALTWKPGHEPRRKTAPAAEVMTPRAGPATVSETSERATRHQAPSALSSRDRRWGPRAARAVSRDGRFAWGSPISVKTRAKRAPGAVCSSTVATSPRSTTATGSGASSTPQPPCRAYSSATRWCGSPMPGPTSSIRPPSCSAISRCWGSSISSMAGSTGGRLATRSSAPRRRPPPGWRHARRPCGTARSTTSSSTWPPNASVAAGARNATPSTACVATSSATSSMMDYPRYRDAGYPSASAAIESANKRLVGRRCKQGGMIWSEPGVEAMVALRVAFYNQDTWHRLWPHTVPRAAA